MALHGARQLGDRQLEATHLNYLAWTLRVCGGRPAESAQLAIEACTLAEQIGDLPQQGWALKYAAQAYLVLDGAGQERAIAALNRSIECFESAGDAGGVMQARFTLGHALISAGRPAAATQMYRTVLSCLDETSLAHFVGRITRATVATALGRSLSHLGWFDEALAELNAGMPYIESYGEPEFLGKTLLLVASAESRLGLVDDAQRHFHRALAIFEAIDLAEPADQARAGLWQLFDNAPAALA
jgi:tetratricopeptide (TPR) repeat protein